MTPELGIIAALIAGFFGSTHCVGMCGAVVILLESGTSKVERRRVWLRRITYNLGRGSFYVVLGCVAGLSGTLLTKTVGEPVGLGLLRILAALLVIAIGLNLIFEWRLTRFLESAGSGIWKSMSVYAKHVLPASTLPKALAAGFLWGALPCGLVYSAVAIAATSGSVGNGALIMLAFWVGTMPALLLIGASAERLSSLKSKQGLRRVAGIIVVLVGLAALLPFVAKSNPHAHHAANNSPQELEERLPC